MEVPALNNCLASVFPTPGFSSRYWHSLTTRTANLNVRSRISTILQCLLPRLSFLLFPFAFCLLPYFLCPISTRLAAQRQPSSTAPASASVGPSLAALHGGLHPGAGVRALAFVDNNASSTQLSRHHPLSTTWPRRASRRRT